MTGYTRLSRAAAGAALRSGARTVPPGEPYHTARFDRPAAAGGEANSPRGSPRSISTVIRGGFTSAGESRGRAGQEARPSSKGASPYPCRCPPTRTSKTKAGTTCRAPGAPWRPRGLHDRHIGCSNGSWSRHARKYWPNSLVPPRRREPAHRPAPEHTCSKCPGSHVKFGAAGPSVGKGEVLRDLRPSERHRFARNARRVRGRPVLHRRNGRRVQAPRLTSSLDTHGYELEILQGAAKTIRDTTMIQPIFTTSACGKALVFPEMCFHMDKFGYRLADVFQVMHRPSDGLMWQADAV